eukprot:CAMPEP_0197295470 /NCGR_PEP_ID=MMETSP0890-20130614/35615_1 /TAXON_ID=44058 ORGANISM="Aureoumbra lagunensis, Strain CCMP1510" /NCGR_SAMPLE_ID=MMETSP0890 /ASSEMBLY_ACC=CAM_ASM_000533 /LENGTH=550 /DNA_ID=CAMNT_0042771481 /DNA_START=159 /DNA_END=1811 /DNA_ORIENTATION=+
MGSLQSALVSYYMIGSTSNPKEIVLAQTLSVSAATMPLAGGFVGIVPALSMMGSSALVSWRSQLWWCFGLAFFGVFAAVPLRQRFLIKERLAFPSGTATAKLVCVLHGGNFGTRGEWSVLLQSFCGAFSFGLIAFFFPFITQIPFLGQKLAYYGWSFDPSPAYAGQGAIMGPVSGSSMLFGAILGYAIIGPLVYHLQWAPGSINDGTNGATAYLLWLALAILLADSIVSLSFILMSMLKSLFFLGKPTKSTESESLLALAQSKNSASYLVQDVNHDEQISMRLWLPGLLLSCALCAVTLSSFLTPWQSMIAVCIALIVALLALRALGETDLNPVSGVGKLSQLVFAILAPGRVLTNLAAGAVAEACATQAGDMLQDLKTGLLLGVSPKAQFHAQLLGSCASIFFTVALYRLYSSVFVIPSPDIPAPSALIWLDFANLCANGGAASDLKYLFPASSLAFIFGAFFSIAKHMFPTSSILPSPVALAIGLYLPPRFSLPRIIAALAAHAWSKLAPESHAAYMVVLASGLVLGEGLASVCTASAAALGAKPMYP